LKQWYPKFIPFEDFSLKTILSLIEANGKKGTWCHDMDDLKKYLTRREVLVTGTGLAGLGTVVATSITSGGLSAFAKEAQGSTSKDPSSSLPVKAIEEVFGVKGTIEPGGVLLIELDRDDLHPVAFGIPLKVDIGFDTEITFQAISQGAIVKWEMTLLDSEVNPVLDALFNQNLQPKTTNLNALHNHWLELNPKIKYLHGTAIGDPVHIAKALRDALEHSHQPFVTSPPGNTHLPNEEITQIIGGMSMISDSVLSVDVERKETFRELGIVLEPAMQVESMFNFQALGNGQAAVNAEFILLPDEVDAVARTLREHDFFVMAVHNHELFIEPNVYYLHSFATGGPLALAHAIRDALNKTNSKFVS
jgi:Domain of Unknown Function (DUF1259)